MKTQLLFADFAKDYGLKEGLILSELCRRTCLQGGSLFHFSAIDCIRLFDYLTEKQIRMALNNLLRRRGIGKVSLEKAFNRTIHFQVSNAACQSYFNAVSGSERRIGIS
jgi:hypothetical protein